MLGEHAHAFRSNRRAGTADVWERAGLALGLAVLVAISAASVAARRPGTADLSPHAPWCAVDDVPQFHFGFAAMAEVLGPEMGTPTECEHGDSSDFTFQATTTGVAVYSWCTNTPSFTRGQEHWMLTPQGIVHWTGDTDAPQPVRVVRAPDLRHLCPT